MKIALAGNPNSGKTTMFNALTGANESVGNWAGVTVEHKEHTVKKSLTDGRDGIVVVDLPGTYSMSPYTSEEGITSAYIKNRKVDVIINIVDATNLSRSLFFTTQLLELGIPVVVALNKADINKKKNTKIDTKKLSEKLGCPVIDTIASSSDGLRAVVTTALGLAGKSQTAPFIQRDVDMSDKNSVIESDKKRFAFVNSLVKTVEKRSFLTREYNSQDKIDAILTSRWFGIPIFAVVMFAVFWISQAGPGVWIADIFTGWLEAGQTALGNLMSDASPLLYALLIDGVVGGAIAVIGFLPLVMVMYFLIALLEDCGYMARVSVVLDPIFKKVGLSGKSVIPFVIGTGCAVPGVMACRTIRNERERRATAMLAPFMPCGAKLPVISLFAGAFFSESTWVGPLMYFAGIIIIFFGALLINRITGNSKKKSYFIMEIPEYKLPSFSRAFMSMCSRGWAYVVKAATVILLCNTAVQIMETFTWRLTEAETPNTSILASIAGPFSYLILPVVGVLSWQLAAAVVTGFIAKENVVGTLAVCFGIINVDELGFAINSEFSGEFTAVAGLAYLMLNLFSPPCFAAIGAMSSEMNSAKWLWSGIALQLATGFTVGFLVYQIGTLITTGSIGNGFAGGLIAVIAIVAIITHLCITGPQKVKAGK